MAALTTIAAISAIAASAFSVGKELTAKAPAAPATPDPIAPPAPVDAGPLLTARRRGTDTGRSSTLLTGPEGLSTPAAASGKTLLGL